jgi:hypothetical protein
MAVTTTDRLGAGAPAAAPRAKAPARKRRAAGPDRLTVLFLAVAAFLVVLALLAGALRPVVNNTAAHRIVVRRVIETKVITTLVQSKAQAGAGSSVTSSVSSSGSAAPAYSTGAPLTRTS